jgi:hypothetical protein
MMHRPSSFKHGWDSEIELQIGSPRSPRCNGLGSPPPDSVNPSGSNLHHHQALGGGVCLTIESTHPMHASNSVVVNRMHKSMH